MKRARLLRIALPPAQVPTSSLPPDSPPARDFVPAWQAADGVWRREGATDAGGIAALVARISPKRVEVQPHPSDVAMTGIALPALPANRRRDAVLGALELMTLDGTGSLVVGFGPRDADGHVAVAWMGADAFGAALLPLREAGLEVDALVPPTADESWTGAGWSWVFPGATGPDSGASPRWIAPALAWTAAALVVGVAGLNLESRRLADEGRALSRRMSAEVKAAFPEVQVVLNPLQQARQMREARRNGASAGGGTAPDGPAMLRAVATLLTQAQAQVQRIDYQDGQLRVRWREGSAFGQAALGALQAQARPLGLAVRPDGNGLRFEADAAQAAAGEVHAAGAVGASGGPRAGGAAP